jgi:hypothetical protein
MTRVAGLLILIGVQLIIVAWFVSRVMAVAVEVAP